MKLPHASHSPPSSFRRSPSERLQRCGISNIFYNWPTWHRGEWMHTSSDGARATQWLRELPDIADLDPEFVYRGTFPRILSSHNSFIISRGSLSLSFQSSSISAVTTLCTEHRFEDIGHRTGTLRLVLSTGECSFVVAPCPLFSLETRIVSCEQSDEPLTLTHTTH